MDEDEPIVHTPREGETLRQYLRRYTSEQRQRIFENKKSSDKFCTIVAKTRWESSELVNQSMGGQESLLEESRLGSQRNFDNLWRIVKELNNYSRLLHFIRLLKPAREKLLEALEKYASEMNSISKWGTVGRILGFTVDNVGTVSGLCLAESNPTHANWAFSVAAAFGLLGLASTVTEMKLSIDALDDLMQKVEEDQRCLNPIQEWYHQSSELERAMENIFPFDFTNKIVEEFVEVEQQQHFNPATLLAKLFQMLKNLHLSRAIDEEELTENLIRFVNCPEAREICLSLFLRRRHPILLDIARSIFQLKYSSWPFYICQSVAALAPSDQRGFSIPVLGRMGLNTVSIVDGIAFLRRPKGSASGSQMERLKNQLKSELDALRRIAYFIEERSNEQEL